jgi:hypothetical protein
VEFAHAFRQLASAGVVVGGVLFDALAAAPSSDVEFRQFAVLGDRVEVMPEGVAW